MVAADPHDILHELLDDLGEVHDVDFLIGIDNSLPACQSVASAVLGNSRVAPVHFLARYKSPNPSFSSLGFVFMPALPTTGIMYSGCPSGCPSVHCPSVLPVSHATIFTCWMNLNDTSHVGEHY